MKTKSEAVKWVKDKADGPGLDWDKQFGAQCVDFDRFYAAFLEVSQFPPLGSNGPNHWPDLPTPDGWTKITDPNAGQAGDVFVFRPLAGKKVGHTGILESDVVDGHFTSVDQNWHPVSATAGSPPIPVYHDNSRVICYYRPNYAPEPAPAPKPDGRYTYVQFDAPLDLVTRNDGTKKWNLSFNSYPEAKPVEELAKGTPFRVFGKAVRKDLDHPTYFMTEDDFNAASSNGSRNYGINTADLAYPPAPAATVAAAAAPAPATPEPETANLDRHDLTSKVYETVRACKVWDFNATTWPQVNAQAVEDVAAGTQVTIVESVHNASLKPDGATYYVREQDKGSTRGINKVDLKEYVAPEATATVAEAGSEEETTIPVNIVPVNPDAWKATFKTNYAGKYSILREVTVFDAVNGTSYTISPPKIGDVVGTVEKDGQKWYRLAKHNDDEWVLVPMSALSPVGDDDDLDKIREEMIRYNETMKAQAVKSIAWFDGLMDRLSNLFRKNKK